jgi:hypothetical protein
VVEHLPSKHKALSSKPSRQKESEGGRPEVMIKAGWGLGIAKAGQCEGRDLSKGLCWMPGWGESLPQHREQGQDLEQELSWAPISARGEGTKPLGKTLCIYVYIYIKKKKKIYIYIYIYIYMFLLSFCVWWLLLNILFQSSSMYKCVRTSFLFMAENIPLCRNVVFFIHSSVHGHLGHPHLLADYFHFLIIIFWTRCRAARL